MKFYKNIKKYLPYIKYSAISELKAQVSDSYLGWFWWILDPLLYMLVYSFIVKIIFGNDIENFPLFVFIGLIAWKFFAATISSSVNIIRSYRSIFLKVNLPKYIIIIVQMLINLIKLFIGFGIIVFTILVFNINISLRILEFIPVLIVYIIFTFGFSLIFAHIGVYIKDLQNITTVLLQLLFYLSGVFYTVDRLPDKILNIFFYINPTGLIIYQFRAGLLYGQPIHDKLLLYWLIIGIGLIIIGLKIMNKYEKEYLKVV